MRERRGLFGGVAVVVLEHGGIGLEEEPDGRGADSLADHLRAHAGFQRAGRVRVAQIVEGDPREPCGCGEAVESLSDGVRMRWPAVLEGKYVVAWVIVGAEEFSLAILPVAPSAEHGESGPINRYRLVGVMG